jgi:hypothetical protein
MLQQYLVPILVTSGIGLALTLLAKFMPKQKVNAILGGLGAKLGIIVDALLISKFTKDNAEKLEEGVFVTAAEGCETFFTAFIMKLRENNQKRA